MRRGTRVMIAMVAALTACGCGGGSADDDAGVQIDAPSSGHGAVRTVTISNQNARLAVGETKQFSATAMFEDGTSCEIGVSCDAGFTVTWEAAPTDRITISATGLASVPTTATPGTATITGTVQSPAVAPPGTAALGVTTGTATVTVTGYAMKVDRGGMTISEGSMDDQGSTAGGVPIMVTYRITNTGTETLDFPTGASVGIQSHATCSITSQLPTMLAAGASGTFTVQVTPIDGPYYCGILVLTGLGQLPNFSFDVTGHGTAGHIQMAVPNGGTDQQGTHNIQEEFFDPQPIQNVGDGVLTVGTVTISNAVNCLASVSVQPAASVAIGQTTNVKLSIRPSGVGTFSFLVTVPSSDPVIPSYTFTVTGAAVVPDIYVAHPLGSEVPSGSADPYGTRAVGVAFLVDYDVLNTGLGPLHIDSTSFQTETNCTSLVVTPPAFVIVPSGASTVRLSITPTAPGSFECILVMTSNDPDEGNYTIRITGTGVTPGSPEIDVKKFGSTSIPTDFSFDQGSLAIGVPATAPLTVTNTGTGSLILDSVTISSQTNCTATIPSPPPMILDPNQPSPVDVQVTPTASGPFDCVLSISNNDTTGNENPFLVHITGQGGFGEIDVETSTGTPVLNNVADPQGDHVLGTAFSKTYTIRNTGDGPLLIPSVTTFNQINCMETITSQPAPSIAPGGASTVTVSVTPNVLGAFDCEVRLQTNDTTGGENFFVIKVTGNGVAPEIDVETGGPPQFSVSSGGGFFSGNYPKNVPIQVDFTVRNTGTSPLAVGAVTFPAANQTGCTATLISTPGSSVAAMSTTTFSISLTPTGGAFSCRVSIVNDDSNENPYTIDVRGNGI